MITSFVRRPFARAIVLIILVLMTVVGAAWTPRAAQDRVIEFTVDANNFAFSPSRILVDAGALVKIRLIAHDIPHTLAIDEYRVLKKAKPGTEVVIEFCAQTRGTYLFYCSLTEDPRCRDMKGQLIVR